MDIVLFIIAMLVFYVLPEVLKRRRKTEYQYPEIPDRVPPPSKLPPATSAPGDKQLPPGAIPVPVQVKKPAVVAPEMQPTAAIDSGNLSPETALQTLMPQEAASQQETSAWQGGLDHAAVVNGIIYSEILQPPKALRRRRGLR